MPSTNGVKVTAGKETTAGDPVTTTAVIPISDPGSLDEKVDRAADPIIIGQNMLSGEYAVQKNVSGALPLAPRACAGMGLLLKSAFGTEEAPPPVVVAIVRIKYTGSSPSCKIATSVSAKTIVSSIGAFGAEAPDSAFGTAGSIDLAATGFDTVGELVAAIEAYADYECKKIFGTDNATIVSVRTDTAMQAKGKDAVLILTGNATGAYAHRFTPDLDISHERPTLTLQLDGYGDNYQQSGHVVNELSFTGALKDFLKGDVSLLGMTETGGQSASAVIMEAATPLNFADAITVIDGADYTYIRDVSVKIANNHREDGYVQGGLSRAYHQRGIFGLSGDLTIRLDTVATGIRAKVASGALGSLLLVFKGKAIGTGGAYEAMIVELPYVTFSAADRAANSGQFDMKVSWKALSPAGTQYDDPAIVWLITGDAAVY